MKANASPAKANTAREPLLSSTATVKRGTEGEGGILRHPADKRQSSIKTEDVHEPSPDTSIPLCWHALAKMVYQNKPTKLHF